MAPLIAYYRVSTRKQGRSGLGLAAQRSAVAAFAQAERFTVIAEFTEVETGKGSDALDRRPQLKAALKAAKKAKCEVAVAKLDRLSRDVAFIASLMAQRVPFIVAELAAMPTRSCCTSTPPWRRRNGGLSPSARKRQYPPDYLLSTGVNALTSLYRKSTGLPSQPPPLTSPASKMRLSVMREIPRMPAGPASDAILAPREVTLNSA